MGWAELGRSIASVKTMAGIACEAGAANGEPLQATFKHPMDILPDKMIQDRCVVVDRHNHLLRLIQGGIVSTLAGLAGCPGCADGPGPEARFNQPSGIAQLPSGEYVVSDCNNHRLCLVSTDGHVSWLAGSVKGDLDGSAATARFNCPTGLAVAPSGDVIIADRLNHKLKRLTADGVVTTLAGSVAGCHDGVGMDAKFECPHGVRIYPDRNAVLVGDSYTHTIRTVSLADGAVTTLAGNRRAKKHSDGYGKSARLCGVSMVDVLEDGRLVIADNDSSTIRVFDPDTSEVSTLAGMPDTHGCRDGVGDEARFWHPISLAVTQDNKVLVCDSHNHRICIADILPKQ